MTVGTTAGRTTRVGPCHHGPMHAERQDEPREPGDHESAYSLLQRGHELLRRRHHAQAAVVLARADRMEPGKGSILEALGRAYYNSGQHEPARRTFEALLEVDPSAHYAHYALGQWLKQLGRSREARTHLRLAVALSPEIGALSRGPQPAGGPLPPGQRTVSCLPAARRPGRSAGVPPPTAPGSRSPPSAPAPAAGRRR